MKAIAQWIIKLLGGVSSSQWSAALQYVIAAEERITAGVDKKAWVIDKLKNVGVTGSSANFITESALAFLRKYSNLGA